MLYRLYEKLRYWSGRARGELWRMLINLAGGECGRGLWIGKGVVWKYFPHPGIQFGESVRIAEFTTIDVPVGGVLRLGDSVKFTVGCLVQSIQLVVIGRNSLFGEYCSIRDSEHGMSLGMPITQQPLVASSVLIGEDVWCGRGVAVLRGVTIEDGIVVGANSVVRSNLQFPRSVYVGTPARLVKARS